MRVGEGQLVDLRAVLRVLGAVVDGVAGGVHEPRGGHPVPGRGRPGDVGAVVGVPVQAGRQLEETPVRGGVFVVVACVGGVDLPFEAAVAGGTVPAVGEVVEGGGGEGEPAGGGGREASEVALQGGHGGGGPEELVVVALWGGDQ